MASPEALPATIRYTRSPSVFSDAGLSPSFLRTPAARKARTVCGCQPVERVTVAMVAPLGPHSSVGCRPRLARRFALGHAKLLSRVSAQQHAGGLAQQRAATTQTPRRPIGA